MRRALLLLPFAPAAGGFAGHGPAGSTRCRGIGATGHSHTGPLQRRTARSYGDDGDLARSSSRWRLPATVEETTEDTAADAVRTPRPPAASPTTAAATSDKDPDPRRSADRLSKARRLLALSQISPSERLEMLETVVPMGSYSLRFGGSGSLEDELREKERGGGQAGRTERGRGTFPSRSRFGQKTSDVCFSGGFRVRERERWHEWKSRVCDLTSKIDAETICLLRSVEIRPREGAANDAGVPYGSCQRFLFRVREHKAVKRKNRVAI